MRPSPVLLLAFALVLAWSGPAASQSDPATEADARPVELARVDVTRLEKQTIAVEVRIAGSLAPSRRSVLTSKVSATIEEMPVQVGDVVKAGDLLVRFDKAALESAQRARRAELDALNAQLSLAESILQRKESLGDRGVSSEASRREAEANVLNLKAQGRSKQTEIDDAERAVRDAVVNAPFDGIVAVRPVEQGQTVAVNTELITIIDLSRMEVDAGVPTSRIPLVKVGQPVELTVEGFSGRPFSASVARVSPTAVAGSRSIRVFLAIPNDDQVLRGGMFTTGILRVDEHLGVIAVPGTAIRHDDQGSYVLMVHEGRLHRRGVTLGTSWPDRNLVEISGVGEGELVVTAPLPDLAADMPVTVAGL